MKSSLVCIVGLLCQITYGARPEQRLPDGITPVVVKIKPGPIIGRQQSHSLDHKNITASITAFLGIPYALPPIGKRRFQPPERVEDWIDSERPFQALFEQPACADVDLASNEPYGSEDCLYLNIYIPDLIDLREHVYSLNMPVLIFIPPRHLRSTLPEPTLLAHHSSSIVVTVASRVGALGYLNELSFNITGNAGILDQQMAIEWIWDNIREFGGDTEAITIAGDTEGATSVFLQTLSPSIRGVFNRAILHNPQIHYQSLQPDNLAQHTTHLLDSLDCYTSDQAECLEQTSLHTLLQRSHEIERLHGSWHPILQPPVFTSMPSQRLLMDSLHPINLLIGYESAVLEQRLPTQTNDHHLRSLSDWMHHIASHHDGYHQTERIYRLMSNEYSECYREDFNIEQNIVTELITDYLYVSPITSVSALFARTHRVYLYEFERPAHQSLHPLMDYVFGNEDMDSWGVDSSEYAEAIRNGWSNFVKSGDPNSLYTDGGVTWYPFDQSQQSYLKLTTPLDSSNELQRPHWRQMAFWHHYLPAVLDSTSCEKYDSYCRGEVYAVTQKQQRLSTVVFILSCFIGLLIVACLLLILHRVIPYQQLFQSCGERQKNSKKHQRTTLEAERKKLHPLPYCDDN